MLSPPAPYQKHCSKDVLDGQPHRSIPCGPLPWSRCARLARSIGALDLVVIAVDLAYWAYRMSGSVGSQLTEAVTGSPSDRIMIYYTAVSAAVGVFLLVKK